MVYIALLRAINVGGHTVSMERLRGLFTELGFTNVRSYIQTGNVFFESSESRDGLSKRIEEHLEKSLGYSVAVALRTVQELEQLVNSEPFRGIELLPDTRHCVMFLADPPPEDLQIPFTSPKGDLEIIGATASELFTVAHILNGKPGNPNMFIEKKFAVRATTRFFHTTVKILEAAAS